MSQDNSDEKNDTSIADDHKSNWHSYRNKKEIAKQGVDRAIDAINKLIADDKHGNFIVYNNLKDYSQIDRALLKLSNRYWSEKLERNVVNNHFSKKNISAVARKYRKLHDSLRSLDDDERQYVQIERQYQKPKFDALDQLEELRAKADFFENLADSMDGRAQPHIARAVKSAADIFEMCSHHARTSNSRYNEAKPPEITANESATEGETSCGAEAISKTETETETDAQNEIVFESVSTRFIYVLMQGIDPEISIGNIQFHIRGFSRRPHHR